MINKLLIDSLKNIYYFHNNNIDSPIGHTNIEIVSAVTGALINMSAEAESRLVLII